MLMFVSDAIALLKQLRGFLHMSTKNDKNFDMVETYSSMGLVMALYVARTFSFCFPMLLM